MCVIELNIAVFSIPDIVHICLLDSATLLQSETFNIGC